MNSFSERSWLTINLAPVGNETRYHSPGDDLAALDPATLQHMGDQTLALAQALADGTPPSERPGSNFHGHLGPGTRQPPLIAGVILLILLLAGFGAAAVKRGDFSTGAASFCRPSSLPAAVAWLALTLLGAIRHGMFWRAHPNGLTLPPTHGVLLVGIALLGSVGREATVGQLKLGSGCCSCASEVSSDYSLPTASSSFFSHRSLLRPE